MKSPEMLEYDSVHTPDSGTSKRNFGVRRRKFGAGGKPVENSRDGVGETAAFQHARRHSALGRHSDVGEFSFGDDAGPHYRAPDNGGRNNGHSNGNGTNKYLPAPRGSRIMPGASIMRATTKPEEPPHNEEEKRLRQLGPATRKHDDFLSNILNHTEKRQVGSAAAATGASRVPVRPRSTDKRPMNSLESASAPTMAAPGRKAPLPVTSTRGQWTAPTRLQRDPSSPPGSKRARVDLTPTQPRRIPTGVSSSNTSSQPTRVSARISSRPERNTFGMYDDDRTSPSNASLTGRSEKKQSFRLLDGSAVLPSRRSTRSTPKPKDGTEDMPIHLSDSDEDEELSSGQNVEASTGATPEDQSEAMDDENFDMATVRKESLVDYQGLRAWFGECACCIDVYVCEQALWLCSVRGVEKKWSYTRNYRIPFSKIKRVLVYRWTPDQVGMFDISDPAGKVMSKASFIALQFPVPNIKLKSEWRHFYDPESGDSSSKGYLILLPKDKDEDGKSISAMEDLMGRPGRLRIQYLSTLDEVRPLAKSMTEHDHHYVYRERPVSDEPRRSRRKRENGEDGLDATQLTYPLPPCTVDLVTITRQDISRLQPAEYLNDNIIDYYLKRLLVEDYAANEDVKQNVLFLSSHFYSRLRAGKGASVQERLAAGYKNVSTWLTRSDFFSRTLVFVPINKDLHWSLAVIINPKCAGSIDESDDEESPRTCIALLDPLGGYHSSIPIMRHLKSFLEFEWERVHNLNSYQPKQVTKVQVKAPLQKNSFDCGVFVLKYAQEMLANFAKMLEDRVRSKKASRGFVLPRAVTDDHLSDLIPHDAFTAQDVTSKRLELQEMIAEDTKRYEAILDAKYGKPDKKAET